MAESDAVAVKPNGTIENETLREKADEIQKAHNGCAPIVDASILITKQTLFVKNLKLDLVMPELENFLSVDEKDEQNSKKLRGWKTMSLLEYLDRKAKCNKYKPFNAFIQILAGIQPELFTKVVGRNPTLSETDFCIEKIIKGMKRDVLKKGHCTDSPLDEEVDFNEQHVPLKIRKIDDEPKIKKCGTIGLPHEYQAHLEENKGDMGTVCDNLNPEVSRRTVIQGRAGIGKSTTMQWLGRQWAVSRWAMEFPVLFLLQLRHITNINSTVTAVELLTLYSLYQCGVGVDMTAFAAWMANSADRMLILIDGLDEISGFAEKMKNTPKISDIKQKASPLDLCINILRGDLLPKCSIISTSRPFTGLSELKTNNTLEILGLTKDRVREYVQNKHPNKAEHIMSVLSKAPLLMSLCSITVYCMLISTLLNEGVELLDEDVQTYTRLTAFILVKFASRKLSKWPFVIEVNSYFSKLTKLAFKGMFESKEEMPKLVFNEYDLAHAQLTKADLDAIEKVGILEMKEKEIAQRKTVNAEFLHLSIQEMLAMVNVLCAMSTRTISSIHTQFSIHYGASAERFNMAVLYLYGLFYDDKSAWIKDVLVASGHTLDMGDERELLQFLNSLILKKDTYPPAKLMLCQLVHEGQNQDHVKLVEKSIAPNGELLMQQAPMTVLDLKAVLFVCQHTESLTEVQFTKVNADDTFIQILSSTLLKRHASTVKVLDLSSNNIGAEGIRALAEGLHENSSLSKLDISNNNLGVDGAKALVEVLKGKENLKELTMNFCNISAAGLKAIGTAVEKLAKLEFLFIQSNELGLKGAAAVADILQENGSISQIALEGNKIDSEGAKLICTALHKNNSLRMLRLANNHIRDEGCKHIAKMLKHNSNVCWLDVSNNNLGEGGATVLASALHNLLGLIMRGNKIGANGTFALGSALQTENNKLQILNVSNNNIGTSGAKSLGLMLESNMSLDRLEIACNNIGFTGAKALVSGLELNDTLQTLEVTGTDIGHDGLQALGELQKRKQTKFEVIFSSVNIDLNITL